VVAALVIVEYFLKITSINYKVEIDKELAASMILFFSIVMQSYNRLRWHAPSSPFYAIACP
jgi:hypothetical protein